MRQRTDNPVIQALVSAAEIEQQARVLPFETFCRLPKPMPMLTNASWAAFALALAERGKTELAVRCFQFIDEDGSEHHLATMAGLLACVPLQHQAELLLAFKKLRDDWQEVVLEHVVRDQPMDAENWRRIAGLARSREQGLVLKSLIAGALNCSSGDHRPVRMRRESKQLVVNLAPLLSAEQARQALAEIDIFSIAEAGTRLLLHLARLGEYQDVYTYLRRGVGSDQLEKAVTGLACEWPAGELSNLCRRCLQPEEEIVAVLAVRARLFEAPTSERRSALLVELREVADPIKRLNALAELMESRLPAAYVADLLRLVARRWPNACGASSPIRAKHAIGCAFVAAGRLPAADRPAGLAADMIAVLREACVDEGQQITELVNGLLAPAQSRRARGLRCRKPMRCVAS